MIVVVRLLLLLLLLIVQSVEQIVVQVWICLVQILHLTLFLTGHLLLRRNYPVRVVTVVLQMLRLIVVLLLIFVFRINRAYVHYSCINRSIWALKTHN